MPGLSVLRVASPMDLKREEDEAARKAMEERQAQPLLLGIAGHLRSCWDAAREAKQPIERLMLAAKRQRDGQYEPDKLAQITAAGGSTLFMQITEVKCRSAEAWIRDILLDAGDTPWELQASPIPALSPEQEQECQQASTDTIMELTQSMGAPNSRQIQEIKSIVEQDYRFHQLQVAQNKADRMGEKIKDQFAEGGWVGAFDDFITDLVTYPAAFIKGPVLRRCRKLSWGKGEDGKTTVQTTEEIAPEYERVDPFRIYPEPGLENLNDG